jgi:hypothetical protein
MNETYLDLMRQTSTDFSFVGNKLSLIAKRIETSERYNPVSELYRLIRTAEANTVQLRDLAARTDRSKILQFYETVSDAQNIEITEEPDWIRITLPAILPKRNRSYAADFLVAPLRQSLLAFKREHPKERLHDCAICIVHQYNASLSPRRVRDYDNIETKRYLDVIEALFLINDTGLLSSVLQCTDFGDADATIFYLMEPDALPKWYTGRHGNHRKSTDNRINGNGSQEQPNQPDRPGSSHGERMKLIWSKGDDHDEER